MGTPALAFPWRQASWYLRAWGAGSGIWDDHGENQHMHEVMTKNVRKWQLSVVASIYLFVCLFTYLSIHPSIHPPIPIFIYIYKCVYWYLIGWIVYVFVSLCIGTRLVFYCVFTAPRRLTIAGKPSAKRPSPTLPWNGVLQQASTGRLYLEW